jgi:hypothetical protein
MTDPDLSNGIDLKGTMTLEPAQHDMMAADRHSPTSRRSVSRQIGSRGRRSKRRENELRPAYHA